MSATNRKAVETHQMDWQGYRIQVRYCPSWSPSYEEIYGECMAHLELMSLEEPRLPLPVTETGYRSHFTPTKFIDDEGGPVAFVHSWLDDAAKSPKWKELEAISRQMSLL
tara:strand:- start:1509 stop:1838 length:330 start_codon:yes stop_codon:yes gene_type:complete